jgi:hypothetical protein
VSGNNRWVNEIFSTGGSIATIECPWLEFIVTSTHDEKKI